MKDNVIISLRPRSEVPRGSNPLPPKSRRRYQRNNGQRYDYIGRFQKPMRWGVIGKMILPDLRPCWRCTLGAAACASCTNPRRADAQKEDVSVDNAAPPAPPQTDSPPLRPAVRAILAEIQAVPAAVDCGDISEDEGLRRLMAMQRALKATRQPRLVVDNTREAEPA